MHDRRGPRDRARRHRRRDVTHAPTRTYRYRESERVHFQTQIGQIYSACKPRCSTGEFSSYVSSIRSPVLISDPQNDSISSREKHFAPNNSESIPETMKKSVSPSWLLVGVHVLP